MEQLKELATCGRPWAESRAQMALEIRSQLYAGEISADEAQELMEDIVRSDRLDAEADDLEIKNLLVSCVMVAAKFS